jgi:hypothetical protein
MITLIARLMAVVLIAFAMAGVSVACADMVDLPPTSDAPNGFAVGGCPDYTLTDDRVVQLCDIASIPDRHRLDPMMPRTSGGVTATERSIEEAKSQSQLADWVVNFSDVLNSALAFAMDWEGVKGKAAIAISDDFPLQLR